MERTEAELIAAVLKGDAASFEPLVEKYSPRIFAMARRYARRESEVEDIVQEVWLKAFEKLEQLPRRGALRALADARWPSAPVMIPCAPTSAIGRRRSPS